MAMIEGSVTVNPVTGTVTGAGCAKEVFDALVAPVSFPVGMTPAAQAVAKEQLAAIARAVAKVIPHIAAHAQVSSTVAPGIPVSTAGTAAAQTGATTSAGTATGTIA